MTSKADLVEFTHLVYDLRIGKFDDQTLSFYPHITDNQKKNFLQYFKEHSIPHIENNDSTITISNDAVGQIDFHNFVLGYLSKQYKEWENNLGKIFPGIDTQKIVTNDGSLGCVLHTDISHKRAAEEAKKAILSESKLAHHAVFHFKPVSPIFGKYTDLVTRNSLESQNTLINRDKDSFQFKVKSKTLLEIIKALLKALLKMISLGYITFDEKKNRPLNISPLILDPSYLTLDPQQFHPIYLEKHNELRNTGISSAHRKTNLHDVSYKANSEVPNQIFHGIVFRDPNVSFSNVATILNDTQKFLDNTYKKLGIDLNPIKESLYKGNAKIKFSHSETIVDGRKELYDSNLRKFCSGATKHGVNEIILPGFQDPQFLSAVLLHEIGHVVSHQVKNHKLEALGDKAKDQLMKYMVKNNLEIDSFSMAAHAKAFQNPNYHKGKDWFSTLIGILPAITPSKRFCNDFQNSPELSSVKEFTESMMKEVEKIKAPGHTR